MLSFQAVIFKSFYRGSKNKFSSKSCIFSGLIARSKKKMWKNKDGKGGN